MDAKFSQKVKEVISYSREEALRLNHSSIGIEHILLGLIREGDGLAIKVLKSLEVDIILLRKKIEDGIKDNISMLPANADSLPLTKQAEKVMRITVLEAKHLKSDTVSTEHLMLAILKNKDNIGTQILNKMEVDYDIFKAELDYIRQDITNEFPQDPSDSGGQEFEDEEQKSRTYAKKTANLKPQFWLILVEILPIWQKKAN